MTKINLLNNPNMDGPFISHGAGEVAVAKHWTPLWRGPNDQPPMQDNQGPLARPEYKPLYRTQFPYRVQNGDSSQCWFLTHKVFDACVYQRVDVEVGAWYCMSANVQAWSSNGDDHTKSEREMYVSLGLMPINRPDPWQLGTVYTGWDWVGANFKRVYSYIVQAQHSVMWAIVRAWPKWKGLHNDFILDHVELYKVAGPVPGPDLPDNPSPTEPGTCAFDWERFRAELREELSNSYSLPQNLEGSWTVEGTITPTP